MESSRELFLKGCPACHDSVGYDFVTDYYETRVIRIMWDNDKNIPDVWHRDSRVSYKSFTKHHVRCRHCSNIIEEPHIRNQLIAIVKKYSPMPNWRRQYAEELLKGK